MAYAQGKAVPTVFREFLMPKIFLFRVLLFLMLSLLFSSTALAGEPVRVVYGFDREFPPFSYEDAGGKPVGFEVELLQAALKDKAVLVMRPLNWYAVPLELSSGTINVTSGMAKTAQRAKTYAFADKPSFALQFRFFTKVYKRVPNMTFLRGQSVAVEEGSYQQRLLKNFGGLNIKPFKSKTLALRALYNDEVEAYCGSDENTYYYLRKLNYGAITTLGTPLGAADMYFAVNRDRGDILRLLNDGLRRLVESGEYNRLYRKWFVPDLTDKEKADLVTAAKNAATMAYVPYGKVNMGAAVLTATGKIVASCNMENAAPALSISALRAALSAAVNAGELEIRAAVTVDAQGKIITPTPGDCQAIYEFGRGIQMLTKDDSGPVQTPMVSELLPNPVVQKAAPVEME